MSLQLPGPRNNAANRFQQLWNSWLTPAGAPAYTGPGNELTAATRGMARKRAIRNAITGFTGNIMPAPTLSFQNMGANVLGGLNWSTWTLTINGMFFDQDDITYRMFILLCRTVYHESRHGEQVYRSAQGLAAQAFPFPDVSQARMIQVASMVGGGGVGARVAAFSGNALNNPQVRCQLIAETMNIPMTVAQHADNNRAGFAQFAALARPAWFKRGTVQLEVEEWMRSLAKKTLFEQVTIFGEGRDAPREFYKDLPVELDAHAIETDIKTATTNLIGHNYHANKIRPRTNVALFGP
jgi:hypothetical protein